MSNCVIISVILFQPSLRSKFFVVAISHFKLKLFLNAKPFSFSLHYLPTINKGPVHLLTESIFITFAVKYRTVITIRASLRTVAQRYLTATLNLSESDQLDCAISIYGRGPNR